jgi:hypothetical protein
LVLTAEFTTNSVCVTLPTFSPTQRSQSEVPRFPTIRASRLPIVCFEHVEFITALGAFANPNYAASRPTFERSLLVSVKVDCSNSP